jgi:hypothetical protein
MSRLAKAVHRGADGSVHYLASSRDGSELIITDPVVGLSRINFDGPCRLVSRSPSLPASYDAVEYKSTTVSGSSSVSVRPGQPPFEHSIGGVGPACTVIMTSRCGRCVLAVTVSRWLGMCIWLRWRYPFELRCRLCQNRSRSAYLTRNLYR